MRPLIRALLQTLELKQLVKQVQEDGWVQLPKSAFPSDAWGRALLKCWFVSFWLGTNGTLQGAQAASERHLTSTRLVNFADGPAYFAYFSALSCLRLWFERTTGVFGN